MNEFEIAMVNEPSVFEPLKFYCRSVLIFTLEVPLTGKNFHHSKLAQAIEVLPYFCGYKRELFTSKTFPNHIRCII